MYRQYRRGTQEHDTDPERQRAFEAKRWWMDVLIERRAHRSVASA
jgi:hypothetical protein